MSYFLRNLVSDGSAEGSSPSRSPSSPARKSKIASDYGRLLRYESQLPRKSYILKLPAARPSTDDLDNEDRVEEKRQDSKPLFDIDRNILVVAAPSAFGALAIARSIVLRYAPLLPSTSSVVQSFTDVNLEELRDPRAEEKTIGSQIVSIGLNCMFSVLWELSRKDSELCVQALQSLLQTLQNLPPEALRNEPKSALSSMHAMLRQLRLEGSSAVSSKASACLAALSVACATPELLHSAVAAFLCDSRSPELTTEDSIPLPENQHKLADFVQQRVFHKAESMPAGDWWSLSLAEHAVLCSLDLSSLPSDSSPETPDDDRRLYGAIASDGPYVYVLNYLGLYKLGTGLGETIVGKLYANNNMLKASRGCTLAICQASLYLRRGQSSRIWVLDVDTLREIGEIILQVTPLNDSFAPVNDAKMKQKFRLTEVSYAALGEVSAIPHQLPYTLPKSLQNQASDLHMGREVAFLLAKNGKVYYAGNGVKLGLQETGSTWMELVLPEAIVQLAVSSTSECVLFRSGSGHVWIAGAGATPTMPQLGASPRPSPRVSTVKLRRLHTVNKRKAISVAVSVGCYAYVTENGRAYVSGRHAMRAHAETGLVLGLEGVHLVAIALGKTHAAAITRSGQLYTWGLNNLNQCGRIEQPTMTLAQQILQGAQGGPSGTPEPQPSPSVFCPPNEHLWVGDVASICVACGKCSARGAACPRVAVSSAQIGQPCQCGPGESTCLRCGLCRACGEDLLSIERAPEVLEILDEELPGTPQKMLLGPARVVVSKTNDMKVASISCGNYHTIVLTADRQVYTFGSNCHGQLGVGDTKRHIGPQKVEIPGSVQVAQVAAGANHCVLRTTDGSVFTFGAHKAGQLARHGNEPNWHTRPGAVVGYGNGTGTIASWIGASGDTTLIHSHRQVFTADAIVDAQIAASKNAILIFPNQVGKDYVVIRRRHTGFHHHQLGAAGLYTSWAIEPRYNVMWMYCAAELRVQALCDARWISFGSRSSPSKRCFPSPSPGQSDPLAELRFMRSPEFAVPVESDSELTSQQLALNLLCMAYALTVIGTRPTISNKDLSTTVTPSVDEGLGEGYLVAARFEAQGGGWGYSAHSVEAIQFQTSKNIRLLGIGLYGGRGEYIAKIRLVRLIGGDVDELYVEQVTETDETLYECGPRETAALLFSRPVLIKANQWHVISAKISGPSSDCGASGRCVVETEDVTFTFRNSIVSNNGTDVNVGQIPELYYQLEKNPNDGQDTVDEAKNADEKFLLEMKSLLRSNTLLTVTPSTFASLYRTLDWAVQKALAVELYMETEEQSWERERATVIAIVSMRMLRFYVRLLYPPPSRILSMEKVVEPSPDFAEILVQLAAITDTLFDIAAERVLEEDSSQAVLLDEAIKLYVGAGHALCCSRELVLQRLAKFMASPSRDWALAAFLYTLCDMNPLLPQLLIFPDAPQTMFPQLATKLLEAIPDRPVDRINALTSLHNVLRFLFDVAFGQSTAENMVSSSFNLAEIAQELIITVAKELVTRDEALAAAPTLFNTPPRFRRRASTASWDMSCGAADAVSLRVDVGGVHLHGVGVYVIAGADLSNFTVEVLQRRGASGVNEDDWELLERTSAQISGGKDVADPLVDDIHAPTRDAAVLKFSKPLKLHPSATYAIRLLAPNGGKTFCGEGGISFVRLQNGARMVFSNCPLSGNGTSLARGQIPFLVYSIDELSKPQTSIQDPDQICKWFLVLLRLLSAKLSDCLAVGSPTPSARRFVSRLSGHTSTFLEFWPQKALEVVAALDQLLPMVSACNAAHPSRQHSTTASAEASQPDMFRSTTPANAVPSVQTVVESPHPYKSSHVHSLVVGFEKSVEFMVLCFAQECATAQVDDVLWVYVGVDRECYVPVARYGGTSSWPSSLLLVPGNSLWFVLEAGSQIEDIDEDLRYGYRCTVYGYCSHDAESNLILEQELAWLCASACRLLVQIPSDPESVSKLSLAEEEARELMEKHGTLLRKGLNLGHQPTVNELLTRSLPAPALTPDLKFVKEFVAASPLSVAGFLSRWLQFGPTVDPSCCQLEMGDDDIQVGKKTAVRLLIRDQYGRVAHCPSLNVEMSIRMAGAMDDPSCSSGEKRKEDKDKERQTKSCLPSLQLMQQNPYQPVFMNKARYQSICMMPAFFNFSYEELRMGFFRDAVLKDTVKAVPKGHTTYIGEWVPRQAGSYRVDCRVDGFQVLQSYVLEVRESSKPETEEKTAPIAKGKVAQLSRAQSAQVDLRAGFKGVRIRSLPSLAAPQLGWIPRGSQISYIEEVENSDGRWLRLTDESTALHSDATFPVQAWCLQHSRALRKDLMKLKSREPASAPGAVGMEDREKGETTTPTGIADAKFAVDPSRSVLIETEEMYIIAEGERVYLYNAPSPEALVEGEQLVGKREVASDGWLSNLHGIWIRIAATHRYILAEDSLGRSRLHTHGQNANGNDDTDATPMRIKPRCGSPTRGAVRPSVVDCCRTVFAAFLWHEHLVKDAMAAAAYLKFHHHLHNLWSGVDVTSADVLQLAPSPLQPLVRLWRDVCEAVQASIDRHLLLSSPSEHRHPKSPPGIRAQEAAETCELCEEHVRGAVTTHMRQHHPGCGKSADGHGYNSAGRYTGGWAGRCGDGGRPNTVWYLICPSCRTKYLKKTPSGHQQERNRRWREFCMSAAAFDLRPETVIRQNAAFLLELNASVHEDSKDSSTATSGWTINLFPQATPPPTFRSTCVQTASIREKLTTTSQQPRKDSDSAILKAASHTSDPGPKAQQLSVHSVRMKSSMPRPSVVDDDLETSPILERKVAERGSSTEILQSPSAALRSLVSAGSGSLNAAAATTVTLRRPVLAFVVEHHDLGRVRAACVTAITRATSFGHAFRLWNWLLRLVSSETSVTDVVWQYLTALSSYQSISPPQPSRFGQPPLRLLPHPWRICFLAGPVATRMVQQMHAFLYTLAVILQSSGVDSTLRSLCFKAWTIQLTAHEQELLILTCNILSTVGAVLSDPSSDQLWFDSTEGTERSGEPRIKTEDADERVDVKAMDDVTNTCKIVASSRQAMVVCLTDGSSETFWESGEEDKNRSRTLTVHCDPEVAQSALLAIFLDNVRDDVFRTTFVHFRSTRSDGSRHTLHSHHVDNQFVGWLKCCPAGVNVVQIVLKGPNPALRVRQLAVLGFRNVSPTESLQGSALLHPSPSHQLLFSTTQTDAFALFQAIAAQAFSDELSQDGNGTLRQQVLDLLFSRVQLQPLQTYVCTQIVNALEREVISLRDRSKRNYSYACGLMVMLVRICDCKQGSEVFAARSHLLITLSELLLFAPQVVQCQVLETLEKVVKLFQPIVVDLARFVQNLLAVVAKVISLQLREKTTHTVITATALSHVSDAPAYWRLDKPLCRDIGRLAWKFIAEISDQKYGEEWSLALRAELATSIMRLVRLASGGDLSSVFAETESFGRAPTLRSRRFWLAVAALSLIRSTDWLQLSQSWATLQAARQDEPELLCENHDDGRTGAQVYCEVCRAALCRDCFHILHLHKKNRNHDVQLIGHSNALPQIEIHEGCSRLRLPNLLVLLHGTTLNGMVELTGGESQIASTGLSSLRPSSSHSLQTAGTVLATCRFCSTQLSADRQFDGICGHEECRKLADTACEKTHSCGHPCGGIRDELDCLPCMRCPSKESRQDGDDVCVVCFTDRLGGAPCIRLACGHIFHFHCVKAVLEKRWCGPRILFRFLHCPLCNQQISHPGLASLLSPLLALYQDVATKAKMRLEYDGLLSCPAVTSPNSEFYNNPEGYAMDRYMYVLCFKCHKAYFGGESRCQLALDSSQYSPSELICGACCQMPGAQVCGRHGSEYLEYKCRFCCSIAVYFCFGTTHFCATCHDDFQRLMSLPKNLLPKCPALPRGIQGEEGPCPLRIEHAPTGEEFALGCGICRNLSTF